MLANDFRVVSKLGLAWAVEKNNLTIIVKEIITIINNIAINEIKTMIIIIFFKYIKL